MYTEFGLKIKHLHNLIAQQAYALFSDDQYPFISHSGFLVLDYIYKNRERDVTQKEIEKALVINRATTSKMLLLLVKKGFITRASNEKDARSKIVSLTDEGEKLYKRNLKKADEFDIMFADILSDEDFEAFDRIYEKLRKAL